MPQGATSAGRRAVLAAVLAMLMAAAAGVRVSGAQNGSDCHDAGSNVEIGTCLRKQLEIADAELNRIYQAALRAIDGAEEMSHENRVKWRAAIVGAQRLWISYRDADCEQTMMFEWWGGSGAGIAITECLLDKTQTRANELRERYGQR